MSEKDYSKYAKEIVNSFGYTNSDDTVERLSDEFKNVREHPKYQFQFATMIEKTCQKMFKNNDIATRSKNVMNKLGHSSKMEDICIPLLSEDNKK